MTAQPATSRPTLVLYVCGPGFGLPEMSPYVTKTEVQLRMAGIDYVTDPTGFPVAPKGKLPFIDDAGEIVADSTFIRAHVERTRGLDLDAGLGQRDRAEAWAIERMIEDHLGWAGAFARFCIPRNFEKGPGRWVDRAPAEQRSTLREALRARVAETLRAQGMGRHRPEEIEELGGRSLAALSALLDDRPYLFGDRPVGVDATAFGCLAGLLTPVFDSGLRRRAEGFGNLVAYAARMMNRFYPGFPWRAAGQDARRLLAA